MLRFALAPGFHIPRLWRSVSTFNAKLFLCAVPQKSKLHLQYLPVVAMMSMRYYYGF